MFAGWLIGLFDLQKSLNKKCLPILTMASQTRLIEIFLLFYYILHGAKTKNKLCLSLLD
jgi:hypothetical protein